MEPTNVISGATMVFIVYMIIVFRAWKIAEQESKKEIQKFAHEQRYNNVINAILYRPKTPAEARENDRFLYHFLKQKDFKRKDKLTETIYKLIESKINDNFNFIDVTLSKKWENKNNNN